MKKNSGFPTNIVFISTVIIFILLTLTMFSDQDKLRTSAGIPGAFPLL